MTREEAIEVLKAYRNKLTNSVSNQLDGDIETFEMAISALENIGHLKDRPCSVCEFHKEDGCCKWTCAFTDRLFGDMKGV